MAEEEDDHHQAPVNEIDKAAEAGDEMDAKRKGKGKKKKERKSKRTILSPSTSGSKKRGRSKGSKDKRPRNSLVFKETGDDDFTFHQLTVNLGEDLVKIIENFNRHYKRRNFCIISVSGTASKAEFDDSSYPLKYEFRLVYAIRDSHKAQIQFALERGKSAC